MNSKLISGVTEFLNTESELNEVNIMQAQYLQLFFLLFFTFFSVCYLKNLKLIHFSYNMYVFQLL